MNNTVSAAVVGTLFFACTGQIGTGGTGTPALDETPADDLPGAGDPGSAGSAGGTDAPARFGAAAASLKRLRLREYQNSVHDLLGPEVVIPSGLDGDLARGGFTSISAAVDPFSSAGIEKFENAAYALAAQVFAKTAISDRVVGCRPANAADPCVGTFVKTFGRRAWRRPLSVEEVDKWTGLVGTIAMTFDGGVPKGLEYVLAGMLQSPHFLYRVDVGNPVAGEPDRRQYSGYEMAARLSYTLWETTPDNALLDAAAAGDLDTEEGIQNATLRLLADVRAAEPMLRFFTELLRLEDLTTEYHPKNTARFPAVSDALYAAMRTELQMGISDVLAPGRDVLDLLTSRTSYLNAALADFYGVPRPTGPGFAAVTLPTERFGYLTSGAFLAINAHADSSSPTRRGVYILDHLLCRAVPPPPPNVDPTLPPDTGASTTRQRLEAHRNNPACAGCHALFDPVGVTFEHFDAIGAYRERENGLAIDTSGELDGVAFDGPAGLAQALRASDEVARCLVSHAYRYNTGHNVVSQDDGEGVVIDALTASFAASRNGYRPLLAAMVQSPAFRFAVGQY